MAETLLNSSSINSGGGTASGTCGHAEGEDELYLKVAGDSNSTSLDFAVTGAHPSDTSTTVATAFTSNSSGIDASTNDQLVKLTGLRGLNHVEVTATNNAASSTTVTVTRPE